MIVVDTNILFYMIITGEFSASASRVYDIDDRWAAPILWRSEFRNTLFFYVRQQILTLPEAEENMRAALEIVEGREITVNSSQVLQLAGTSHLTAYDGEFVAAALELGVPLVTADRQIIREFPEIALSPEQFVARHHGGQHDRL